MNKRITSMVVVAGMLLGSVLPTLANEGKGADTPSWSADSPGALPPTEVQLSAQKTTLSGDTYRILFELESEDIPAVPTRSLDAVLLINTSVAYADSGGLAQSLVAAKELAEAILAEGADNRVAVLAFDESVRVVQDFATPAQKQSLLTSLSLSSGGQGNYLEAGLRAARELLAGSAAEETRIFLLSNGEASYSTKVKLAIGYPYCGERCGEDANVFWEFDITYDSKQTRVGSPVGLSTQLSFGNVVTPHLSKCAFGITHAWVRNRYPSTHGDTAIYESDLAVDAGTAITVLSHGAEAAEGAAIGARIASAGRYTSFNEEYQALLKSLAGEPPQPALTAGVVTLPLGEYVMVDTETLRASEGTVLTYHKATNTLLWELEKESKGFLSLEVSLDVTQPGFRSDEEYSLFSGASFSYRDTEQTEKSGTVPPITVAGCFTQLVTAGVWVTSEGNYRTEQGTETTDPTRAKVLIRTPQYNEHAVNQWAQNQTVTLPRDTLSVPAGYVLFPAQEALRLRTQAGGTQTETYKLVETNLSYGIDYYYEGQVSPFEQVQVTGVPFGTTIHQLADSALLQPGYVRVQESLLPVHIVDHSAVFTVEYGVDHGKRLPYTIDYYRENKKVGSEEKTVPQALPQATITPDETAYPGYSVTEIWFGEQRGTTTLGVSITEENNLVQVYYTKDETQRLLYEVITWKGEEKTVEQHSVWVGDPWVTHAPAPEGIAGYTLDGVSFHGQEHASQLTAKITSLEHQFVVRYSKKPPEEWDYVIYHHVGDDVRDTLQDTVSSVAPAVVVEPKEYAGYTFAKIVFYELEFTAATTLEITPQRYEIHVYYTQQAPLPYTLQYLDEKGNVIDETTEHANPASPVVRVAPPSTYRGHRVTKIAFEGQEAHAYLEVTLSKPNQVIEIHCTRDDSLELVYINKYFYNNTEDTMLGSNQRIWAGNDWLVTPSTQEREGYVLVRTEPAFPFRVKNGNKISYYYESQENVFLPYTIEYYRDDILVPNETVSGKVSADAPSVVVTPAPDKFSGYALQGIRFGTQEGHSSLTGHISEQSNRFAVYYTSLPQTKLGYQVVYYYNGLLDTTKTEHLQAQAQYPQVTAVPLKPLEGYEPAQQFVLPALPCTVAEGDTIAVYYVPKPGVEPETPEPETPEPETPEVEPPKEPEEELPLRVEVMLFNEQGNEEEALAETIDIPQGIPVVLGDILQRTRRVGTAEYKLDSIYIRETSLTTPPVSAAGEMLPLGSSGKGVQLGQSGVRLGDSGVPVPASQDISPYTLAGLSRRTSEIVLGPYDSFVFLGNTVYQVLAHYSKVPAQTTGPTGSGTGSAPSYTAQAKQPIQQTDRSSTLLKRVPIALAPPLPPPPTAEKQKNAPARAPDSTPHMALGMLPQTGRRKLGSRRSILGVFLLLGSWIVVLRKRE